MTPVEVRKSFIMVVWIVFSSGVITEGELRRLKKVYGILLGRLGQAVVVAGFVIRKGIQGWVPMSRVHGPLSPVLARLFISSIIVLPTVHGNKSRLYRHTRLEGPRLLPTVSVCAGCQKKH